MTRRNDDTNYPQDKFPDMIPMHCSLCGSLLGRYSPETQGGLDLRCPSCKSDYKVILTEEATSFNRRNNIRRS